MDKKYNVTVTFLDVKAKSSEEAEDLLCQNLDDLHLDSAGVEIGHIEVDESED
jgi:hypothetical protein